MSTTSPTHHRPLTSTVAAIHTLEGGGFSVYRPFPTGSLEMLDPFLLLDEMGPTTYRPGEAKGAPDHPHRGFETVTYLLSGEVEHRDSNGGHGIIGTGDVQWMTAGDGIVHSEMPSTRIQAEGGTVHGFQIWVNLPQESKRAHPRYQGVTANGLGRAAGNGWQARVIAGSLLGASGPATPTTPVVMAHLTLEPGATIDLDLPESHNVGLYAFGGSGRVADNPLPTQHLAVAGPGQGAFSLTADTSSGRPLDVLVLAGEPLGEPVARYGPFVMNTKQELIEAFDDFQAGRMGRIVAIS